MESSSTFTPLIRLPLYCVHFKVSLTKAQAVIFLCKEPFMWPSLYCVHFKVSLTKAQSVIFLCKEPFMRPDFLWPVIVTGLMGLDVSLGFILENVSILGKTKLYVSTGTEFDHVVSLVNH